MTERRRLHSTLDRCEATLDERIGAALGNGKVASSDLELLIGELEVAVEQADADAQAEREKSLDPTTSAADAHEAAQRASTAELRRDRLRTALPRLQQRLAEALRADFADRWGADATRVDRMIADASIKLFNCYRELTEPLLAALREAEAANREAARVNGGAPDGVHRRVDTVDLTPVKDLVLPDPSHPGTNLYPPYTALGAIMAASMTAGRDPRYSADWPKAQAARAEAVRAEQARMAEYYERTSREQEERQNREQAEAFQRSQQRRG
jgi:hypothetical protein